MVDEKFFNSATVEKMLVSGRDEKWRTYPQDVLPFFVAEPDFPVAPEIKMAIINALSVEQTYYAGPEMIREANETIAAKIRRRNGLDATADDVMMTHAVTMGMWLAIKYACREGDEVVVSNPMYGPFFNAVEITNTRPLHWNIYMEEGYSFDADRLKELVTDHTRLIFVCNPHNPCGRVLTEEELKGIADVAVDHGIHVWVDELWEDIVFDGRRHITLASLSPEIADLTITHWGFSKTYGVSGLRMGYLCAMNKMVLDGLKRITRGVYREPPISTLDMAAMPVMLDGTLDWFVEGMMKHLHRMRALAERRFSEISRATLPKAEGTYLVFPRLDYGMTSDELQKYLYEEAKVRLASGTHYGPGGEGHMRMVVATSEAILNEGFDRMDKALRKLE